MMMNLFSSFDPTTNMLNLSMNWMSTMMGMLLIPLMYWVTPPRMSIMILTPLISLNKEMKILMKNKEASLIFMSLFIMIFFNNFLGLFPYIFTSPSHLTFSLTLALPLWMSFNLYGWLNNTIHMLSHLVPQNTPPMLMPFMVLIETSSNMIRTITLSVRLTANMIAGHLLMTLLSNMGPNMPPILLPALIITQILLLTLESAVAMIQSYVFIVLSVLYSNEVN
uniref:ATP synthase F0 subunit 6 n=1 Tax=Blasticotoma filiceti TaxID=1141352 RepID=UPI00220BAAE7|nr:ATP synthase F0 subunit 6 [Blasticotoma filiceti]UXW93442.1 ATP synthase F0 subunit 6 [Blasticotoma filiceti]